MKVQKIIEKIAWGFLIIGVCLFLKGSWIPMKAGLAQILLNRAWEKSQTTGISAKPWPWADTTAVARIYNKRLNISYIVLDGTSGQALAFGPGHQKNSGPLHGGGNKVVAGHRDTNFSFLQNLRTGDEIGIETITGEHRSYIVQSSSVKRAENIYLHPTEESWLTLITCYPFDALIPGGPERFLVFAKESGLPI